MSTFSITVHNLDAIAAARVLASAANPPEPVPRSRFIDAVRLLDDVPEDVAILAEFFLSLSPEQLDRVWVAALIDHLSVLVPAGVLGQINRAMLVLRQRLTASPPKSPESAEPPQLPSGQRARGAGAEDGDAPQPIVNGSVNGTAPAPGHPKKIRYAKRGPYTPTPGTRMAELHAEMLDAVPTVGSRVIVGERWKGSATLSMVYQLAQRDERFLYHKRDRDRGIPTTIERVKE